MGHSRPRPASWSSIATRRASSLERELRAAIDDGRLASGARLPSSRTLASDLGIARNSIADVYAQLTAEGWLEARVGAGTWVSERAARPVAAPDAAAIPPAMRADLRGGIPDASAFPRRAWIAAARRAVLDTPAAELGYPPDHGSLALRATLSDYLGRVRGVVATVERTVVARGFGELLGLTCRALASTGARRIAVEEVGHEAHREIIRAAGLTPVAIPVDAGGAVIDGLGDADAVLLTAAHQFPIGVPLSPARRLEVVRWAERTGGLVIEDDYDGEFRYDRRAIGALQALAPDHVLYAGTASKSLAPAVGLAWGVVPERLAGPLAAQRRRSGGLGRRAEPGHPRPLHRRARLRPQRATPARRVPGAPARPGGAGRRRTARMPHHGPRRRTPVPPRAPVGRERGSRDARRRSGSASAWTASGRSGSTGTEWRHPPAMVVGYGAPPPHRFDEAIDLAIRAIRAAGD